MSPWNTYQAENLLLSLGDSGTMVIASCMEVTDEFKFTGSLWDKTQAVNGFYFCTALYDPTYTFIVRNKILIDIYF